MCVIQASPPVCQEKNLWSAPPLPPCFPTHIKVNTDWERESECVCVCVSSYIVSICRKFCTITSFLFQIPLGKAIWLQLSSSPCQPFSSWPSPSFSSLCFISLRPSPTAKVRRKTRRTHVQSWELKGRPLMTTLTCVFVCVACCSGKVVKAAEAQTNKQEDKKDVPGKTTHTHTRARAQS